MMIDLIPGPKPTGGTTPLGGAVNTIGRTLSTDKIRKDTAIADNIAAGGDGTVPVGTTDAFGGRNSVPAGENPNSYSDPGAWMLGRHPDYAGYAADQFRNIGDAAGKDFAGLAGQAINQGAASGAQMNALGAGGLQNMANLGARQSTLGQGGLTGLSTMAGQAMGIGQAAQQQLGGYGMAMDGRAQAAAARATPMTNFGAAGATQGGVMGNINALAGLEAQQGPSGAQAQLQSGLNAAQASNIALARSGRGFGGNAAAMAQAQGLNAAAGQQASNQAMMLKAQEDAAWRQRQAANLGAAGQLGTGIAGQQVGQAQFLTQADLQARQINDQAQIAQQNQALQGMTSGAQMGLQGQQMGIDAYGRGLDYAMQGEQGYADTYGRGLDFGMAGAMNAYNANMGGMTLGGQMAQSAYGAQMGGMGAAADIWRSQAQQDMAREQNRAQWAGLQSGVALQNSGTQMQLLGAGMGALGAIGGAMIGGPGGAMVGGTAGAAGGQAIAGAAR